MLGGSRGCQAWIRLAPGSTSSSSKRPASLTTAKGPGATNTRDAADEAPGTKISSSPASRAVRASESPGASARSTSAAGMLTT
jgi:hypothetical protein